MKITKVYTRGGDKGKTSLVGGQRVSKACVRLEAYGTIDELGAHLGLLAAWLPEGAIAQLEQEVDAIMKELPERQGFVLRGGTQEAAQAHICCTICRRAERRIVALAEEATVSPEVQQYVNRLSDYLFVLAKKLNFMAGKSEKIWQNACK